MPFLQLRQSSCAVPPHLSQGTSTERVPWQSEQSTLPHPPQPGHGVAAGSLESSSSAPPGAVTTTKARAPRTPARTLLFSM